MTAVPEKTFGPLVVDKGVDAAAWSKPGKIHDFQLSKGEFTTYFIFNLFITILTKSWMEYRVLRGCIQEQQQQQQRREQSYIYWGDDICHGDSDNGENDT